jgi:hypothetical protein
MSKACGPMHSGWGAHTIEKAIARGKLIPHPNYREKKENEAILICSKVG